MPGRKRCALAGPGRIAAVLALLVAAPASASELVQVRVGNHPTFTRVVFEFDAPTGYQLERHAAGEDANTIVVTLQSAARPRNIASKSAGVASVSVAPGADAAIARIVTRKPDLPIKEMILADPPRVVLDLMLPQSDLRTAKAAARPSSAPKAVLADAVEPPRSGPSTPRSATPRTAPRASDAPAPAPKVATPEPALAPKVTTSEPAPAPKIATPERFPKVLPREPAPAPAPKATEPAPAPKIATPEPAPKAAARETAPRVADAAPAAEVPAREIAAPEPAPSPARPPGHVLPARDDVAEATAVAPEPAPASGEGEAAAAPEAFAIEDAIEDLEASAREALQGPEAGGTTAAQPEDLSAELADVEPPARGPADAVREVPTPEAAQTPLPQLDYARWGAIAGGALAVLLVAFFLMRRRRAIPNDMDVTALAAESDAGRSPTDVGYVPSGGFAVDSPLAPPGGDDDYELGATRAPRDEDKPDESIAASATGAGLFDEPATGGEATTMDSQDQSMETMSEAATQFGAGSGLAGLGDDSDVARMVQELERRMSHLETRLDEANEARERLERQVAAQSEELRVQRAAIARTQRALRSLNRSEEEQATEPALRDPAKPAGRP